MFSNHLYAPAPQTDAVTARRIQFAIRCVQGDMTSDIPRHPFRLLADAILDPMSEEPSSPYKEASQDARAQTLRRWVARMAGGEESALAALYEATLPQIYGLALRITTRRDLAEEVVVEVFWQAWREASRFDPERGEVLAWLLVMCRSRALDILRRQDEADPCPDPADLLEGVAAPDGSPLDCLLTVERHTAVHGAMQTLTPVQRQLVALAFFRGLSHQEICDHTGLPLGTVKSHLKRAQSGLKSALGLA